jgi:hypothetical protein
VRVITASRPQAQGALRRGIARLSRRLPSGAKLL